MSRVFALAFLLVCTLCLAQPITAQTEGTQCIDEPTDQPISYGTVITCTINPVGDTDFFRFMAVGNERIVVQASRVGGSSSPCLDLFPSGVTACAISGSNRLIVTLNTPGLHSIRIRDRENDNTANYTLVLERLLPNPSNARTVHFGETLTDRIDPVGDLDLYVFEGVAGATVSLHATRVGGSSAPCLELFDPDSVQSTACAISGSNSLTHVLPETGSYVVMVRDRENDNVADYTLTLECLSGSCAADQATISVPATSSWVDTGVDLAGGQLVAFRAIAEWHPDPALPPVGPMGRAEPCGSSCPIDGNHGALLGRIGSNPPFFVGEGFSFLINPAWSGRLELQINDDVLGDNTGSATVHVLYSSPPLAVDPRGETGFSELLSPAAPNPFAESTRLQFRVSERSSVRLQVYDMAGRLVRSLLDSTSLEAGEHSVQWDGRGEDGARRAPGVYFYRLEVNGHDQTRTAILLK